jgi:prepilin-type N-terminal cleavage/methylation domain-containing protein
LCIIRETKGVILKYRNNVRAFTLIEMSIVLVIIGLIVGGVLVGQSLVSAAEVRAQITQIEKYNSAVNTFRGKFNYLPGDILLASANQFGFLTDATCTGTAGKRNGDGLINAAGGVNQLGQANGEIGMFWQDVASNAAGNLIEGQYPSGGAAALTCSLIASTLTMTPGTTFVGDYIPAAKIGHGNYIYVYGINGFNWYGLSAPTQITTANALISSPIVNVAQAYSIDAKMDDGLPLSGNVQAAYLTTSTSVVQNAPNTAIAGGNATSCFDTTTGAYSVTVNNGNGGNCALSFKFQ